jgi:hypothetical protein
MYRHITWFSNTAASTACAYIIQHYTYPYMTVHKYGLARLAFYSQTLIVLFHFLTTLNGGIWGVMVHVKSFFLNFSWWSRLSKCYLHKKYDIHLNCGMAWRIMYVLLSHLCS